MFAELIPVIAQQGQRKSSKYYPRASNAGLEKCIRATVYHGLGIEGTPFTGRTMLVFDDGNWAEEVALDFLRKTVHKIHSEQMVLESLELPFIIPGHWCMHCKKSIPAGNTLHCHIDGVTTENITNIDRLLECKSCSPRSYERFEKGGIPYDYISQSCIYIAGLQKTVPDLNEGIILFKNKGNGLYMEYRLVYDNKTDNVDVYLEATVNGKQNEFIETIEKVNTKTVQRFTEIDEYVKKKTLPKRQYQLGHWRCKKEFCRWHEICWANSKKEFEELATDVDMAQDMHDLVGYYLEVDMHQKEMKKECDARKAEAEQILIDKNIRKGKVTIKQPVTHNGKEKMVDVIYFLERELKTKNVIDKTKVPYNILKEATEEEKSFKFKIRKQTIKERKAAAKKKFNL